MSDQAVLRKLRRLSVPILFLLTAALVLLVVATLAGAATILFFFHGGGAWRASVSFYGSGINLAIVGSGDPVRDVPLEALDFTRRSILAAIALACAACGSFALFHLRQLFALHAQGVVFADANIRHIKRFAIWLVFAAIVLNLSGRLFLLVTGQHAHHSANAMMALVYGGMTYAIARVMELGRQADLERKEFV